MRKKYILILLVLGVVLIAGCVQKAVNEEAPADTSQGNSQNKVDSGATKNNTDSSKGLKSKQDEDVKQIQKFQTICTDWSVYENIELGIKIKYRSSNYSKTCVPGVDDNQVTFALNKRSNVSELILYSDFTITALENDNSLSGKNYVDYLKEQAAAEGEPWYYSGPGMTEKETKINGYDSYMYDGVFGGDNTYRIYWITYKDKAVSIRFTDSATPNYDDSENLEIFEEMLGSFEFIDYLEKNSFLQEGVELKNDKIFFNNKERGHIRNGKIFIKFKNDIISFNGDIGKVIFSEEGDNIFYYNGLQVSDDFYCAYRNTYETVDKDEITFACDGPLADYKNGDFTALGRDEVNWQYCETDGKEFLTQFELTAASGYQFGTGGGFIESWKKLYIKEVHSGSYIFTGNLGGDFIDSDPSFYDKEKYKYISSKEYLDVLLAKGENENKIKEWDQFVDSFEVVD